MAVEIRGLAPLLQVFDMPTSIRFYRDQLGFEVVGNDGKPADHYDWALLRLDGSELMLNTAYEAHERPPAPDPSRIASHGDTAIYFGCPDVEGTYAQLAGQGIKLKKPRVTHYGFKEVSFHDPDGYYLFFHWPVAGWSHAGSSTV